MKKYQEPSLIVEEVNIDNVLLVSMIDGSVDTENKGGFNILKCIYLSY